MHKVNYHLQNTLSRSVHSALRGGGEEEGVRCFEIGNLVRLSDIARFELIRPVIAEDDDSVEVSRSIEEPGAKVPGFQKLITFSLEVSKFESE